jgi:hypothetical protein
MMISIAVTRANRSFQFKRRMQPLRPELVEGSPVSVDTSRIAVGAFVTVVSYPSSDELRATGLGARSFEAASQRRLLKVAAMMSWVRRAVLHVHAWLVSCGIAVLTRTSTPAVVATRTMRGAVSVEYLLVTAIVSLALFYDFDGSGSAAQKFFSAIRLLYSKFTYALSRPA